MDYTTNYHLPQWVKEDRVMMEHFNAAMAGIDQGIKDAKDTANTAESKADAAQAAADAVQGAYTPGNQPYATGMYTGTGEDVTITLGFRPKFLIVAGMVSFTGNSQSGVELFSGVADGTMLSKRLTFTDTGFIARAQNYTYNYYPNFTDSGRVYSYIAFR